MTDTVTLEFLGTQQRRILSEMSLFRGVVQDDIRVLSVMAQRQDNAIKAIMEELHRINQQLSLINEQLQQIPVINEQLQQIPVINEQLSVINQRLSAIDNISDRLAIVEGRVAGP